MDRIDRKILEILQDNCRISNQELAEQVALSPSPCLRRVKQLEDKGIIAKHVALLNPEALGLHLSILVLVGLDTHAADKMRGFEQAMREYPEVIACYLVTGQSADYMLRVIVTDMQQYQSFLLDKLTRISCVATVHSSFILQNIVDKTALPLDHL